MVQRYVHTASYASYEIKFSFRPTIVHNILWQHRAPKDKYRFKICSLIKSMQRTADCRLASWLSVDMMT